MKKSDLMNIIKECLDEILNESTVVEPETKPTTIPDKKDWEKEDPDMNPFTPGHDDPDIDDVPAKNESITENDDEIVNFIKNRLSKAKNEI